MWRLAVFFVIVSFCQLGRSQTITVRLIDGKSGKPLSNLHVVIFGIHEARPGIHKVRTLPIVKEQDTYKVDVTGEEYLQFGAANSTTPRIVQFIPCQKSTVSADVKEIQAVGSISLNSCSRKSYPVIRGELIIFVRKVSWWGRWKDFG